MNRSRSCTLPTASEICEGRCTGYDPQQRRLRISCKRSSPRLWRGGTRLCPGMNTKITNGYIIMGSFLSGSPISMVMGRGELPHTLRWRADWVMRLALQGGEEGGEELLHGQLERLKRQMVRPMQRRLLRVWQR